MLGKYIRINGVQFPNPVSGTFAPALNPIENIYTTEDGHQASNIIRLDRFSFDAQFNCSGVMRARLEAIAKMASCTVEVEGVEYEGRLRLSGSITMIENSERTEGTQGLWVVPVKFEEF
jgi:hypothetical protein